MDTLKLQSLADNASGSLSGLLVELLKEREERIEDYRAMERGEAKDKEYIYLNGFDSCLSAIRRTLEKAQL